MSNSSSECAVVRNGETQTGITQYQEYQHEQEQQQQQQHQQEQTKHQQQAMTTTEDFQQSFETDLNAMYKEDKPHEITSNSTLTLRNILQGILQDNGEPALQDFLRGSDGITQLHLQMPLSINDLQNLQKITNNVFMSQAAPPEEPKVLDTENGIVECQDGNDDGQVLLEESHDFLGTSSTLDKDTTTGNAVDLADHIVPEEGTGSLITPNHRITRSPDHTIDRTGSNGDESSFSADQHGNLFVKTGHTNKPGNIIQGEEVVEGVAKTDSEPVSPEEPGEGQLFSGIPCERIVYFQVNSSETGGEPQVIPVALSSINPSIGMSSTTNAITASSPANISVNAPNVLHPNSATLSRCSTVTVSNGENSATEGNSEGACSKTVILVQSKNKKKSPDDGGKRKSAKKTGLRNLAPRLVSLPLYAGAQAAVGFGKDLLKPMNLGSLQLVEGGQYFEVLGRCTQCFRFSRTTTYCRAEKSHREPRSSVCTECELLGLSTVVCRRKLSHNGPNALPLNIVINTALQKKEHVQELCIKNHLPPCFCELQSIVLHHADITFVGQRRDHGAPDMKPEIKYNLPEFSTANLLSSETVIPDNPEMQDILSGELGGKGEGILIDGNDILPSAQITNDNILSSTHISENSILSTGVSYGGLQEKSEKLELQDCSYSDYMTIPRVSRKPTDYARGYLYPYTKEKWTEWMQKFCQETSTSFRVRTGKRVNKKNDHGLANHNGRIVPYRTLETQLYNCQLGGKPRKRKTKDGTKKRKERGSKLIGCPAVIHTRLVETEYNWCALEVTVPKILAHIPFHDPRGTCHHQEQQQQQHEREQEREQETKQEVEQQQQQGQRYEQHLQNNHQHFLHQHDHQLFLQQQQEHRQHCERTKITVECEGERDAVLIRDKNFSNVTITEEEKNELLQKSTVLEGEGGTSPPLSPTSHDVKRNTKSLFLTCASLTDMIDNSNFLLSIQEQSCDILNRLHKEAVYSKDVPLSEPKRMKFNTDEVGEEGVGMGSEIRVDVSDVTGQQASASVHVEQIEHIEEVDNIGVVNIMN